MMFSSSPYTLGFLTLLATIRAAQLPRELRHVGDSRGQQIQWGPCSAEINATSTAPIECGSFVVPLDYTEPTNETIRLELLRIPASKFPSKGSIFFNFGGPGDSGKESLPAFGKLLLG